MKNIIARLFNRQTPAPFSVSEVISDFENKIQSLKNVHEARNQSIASNSQTIVRLNQENKEHDFEATKAKSIASKLEAILA